MLRHVPTFIEPRCFTVNEAASLLRLSRASVYELMKHSRINFFYLGRRRRIPADEIERVLSEGVT
jgi:excisionase family DNA binding protein